MDPDGMDVYAKYHFLRQYLEFNSKYYANIWNSIPFFTPNFGINKKRGIFASLNFNISER